MIEVRLRELFEQWRTAGIDACVWKSADRWREGLSADTDIDLLIDANHQSQAHAILRQQGWVPVRAESWRTFPGLHDFISLRDGVVHHLHLHSQIVSGEKLVKSLRPPLNELYLQSVPNIYPPFVRTELEFILYIVRMIVKIDWIDRLGAIKRGSARAIYRNYDKEYQLLKDATDKQAIRTLLDDPRLVSIPSEIVLDAWDDLGKIGWRQRREMVWSTRRWRTPKWSQRCWLGVKRNYQKRRDGVGKQLLARAPTVAICGADGSGKTTLVAALQKLLQRQLRVHRYYMGSNVEEAEIGRRLLLRSLWLPYLVTRKACKLLGWSQGQALVERLHHNLDLRLQRREKCARLAAAERDCNDGTVVLFERYPLFNPHGDDLIPSVHGDAARLPDLLVLLEVDSATARARRPDDPAAIIEAKVSRFTAVVEELDSKNLVVLVCKEEESVAERVTKISQALDHMIASREQG